MTKTVYAHTPPGSDFPPFVNLSRQRDGTYTLTVRSEGNDGRDMGSIKLSPEAVEALTIAALADLYGETPATIGMNFGEAITALKAGERIARTGWNGKGMFVYLVPPASYPVQTGAAKAYFGEGAMVPYNAYMAIKNVDGTVGTWVPSVNDCLASDWGIVCESATASTMAQQNSRIGSAGAMVGASASISGQQRTSHREELERLLASGASAQIAHNPENAAAIAKGIKTVLDELAPVAPHPVAIAPLPVIDPGPNSHASAVLYPAIERAMEELGTLHPAFNFAVNRAFNHLHDAFWSECPAPASAAPKRPDFPGV